MKDQIRGKAEEFVGKATGDRSQEMKGKARQAVGNLKRSARDIRGDAQDEVDRTKREQDRAGLPRSR
jgi:uncharacterized protein YjbJ (UPF0337 family)